VLGQNRSAERLGDVDFAETWKRYERPVDLEEAEYGFARCSKSKKEAVLVNRYNETAASRAKSITSRLRSQLNVTSPERPLAVYMLVFDSVSRQHFYRNFPKTIAFLNDNLSNGRYRGKYRLYDFVVNNAHGENTQPNMVPWLYGYNLKYHKRRLQGYSIHSSEDTWKYVELQREALWKLYEDMGFVTLFGFDTVWDFLVKSTGRVIDTDHMISNFYRASKRLFGYMDFMERQRCIGLHNAHYYSLNYLQQYNRNYKGLNRFAYIHLSPGHEKSGTVIKTADYDLMLFLEAILDDQKQRKDEDFVLVVAADHGKHSSEWDKLMEGFLENQLPVHLMVTNSALIGRLQAEEIVQRNTHRLVSRLDWYLTFRHLATVPYGQLHIDSPVYQAWKRQTDSSSSLSVLLEPVPDTRTCADLDIPMYYCTCVSFTELPAEQQLDPVQDLARLGVRFLNAVRREEGSEDLCRRLTLGEVLKAGVQVIGEGGSWMRNFKVRITVKESKNARFEVIGLMADKEELTRMKENRPTVPTTFRTAEGQEVSLLLQLQEVIRVDVYEGVCEELALAAAITPQYCICQLPFPTDRALSGKQLVAVDQLAARVDMLLARQGQSCKDACSERNKACHTWGLALFNDHRVLSQDWKDRDFYPLRNLTSNATLHFRDIALASNRREGSTIRLVQKGATWILELAVWAYGPTCDDPTYYGYAVCPCY